MRRKGAALLGLLCAAMAVTACGGGASAPLPAATGSTEGKARVLFYAQPTAVNCTNMSVSFARKNVAGGYAHAAYGNINLNMFMKTNLASVDLDPGEYFITSGGCATSDYASVRVTGKTAGDAALFKEATVVEPLGRFSVAAGEVVAIGDLVFLRLTRDGTKTEGVLLVSELLDGRLADLRKASPDMASRVVRRPVTSLATDAELATAEQTIMQGNYSGSIGQMMQEAYLKLIRDARARQGAASASLPEKAPR